MIDPDLLKSLGWDDALIAEVNRVAALLRIPDAAASTLPRYDFAGATQGATTFYFGSVAKDAVELSVR